jgi:hypothetical protein
MHTYTGYAVNDSLTKGACTANALNMHQRTGVQLHRNVRKERAVSKHPATMWVHDVLPSHGNYLSLLLIIINYA